MTMTEQPAPVAGAMGRVMSGAGREDLLNVNVELTGDAVVAALSGDLTISTVHTLTALVGDLTARGELRLILDCQRLYTVDAQGLAGLHSARTALEECGGSLTMTNVRPKVRAILIRAGAAARFGVLVGAKPAAAR